MRRNEARAAAAISLLAVLATVLALAGCGGSEDAEATGTFATGPAAFADESYAEIATDGEDGFWLAVGGYRRDGTFGLRVFRLDGSRWIELPDPPGQVSSDVPISITPGGEDGAEGPCLGYSVGDAWEPMVTCYASDRWREAGLPRVDGQLLEIGRGDAAGLVALFTERAGARAHFRLLHETREGWFSAPPFSSAAAIAKLTVSTLGSEGADAVPSIGLVTQGRRARHSVVELRGGDWRPLQPVVSDAGTGPAIGGPIVSAGRVFYPVNEAQAEPWVFSVHSGAIGSPTRKADAVRLSAGAGNTQGRLDLVGDRPWASWQEDDPRKDGRFNARILAAELSPSGEIRRKVSLWRGVSIGPGNTQVVSFDGRTIALFMRASSNGKGLQATLRQLVGSSP